VNKSGKVFLKIEARGKEYSFSYGTKEGDWILLKDKVDASFLSPRNVYGFVGTVIGMYATSLGKQSDSSAYFDWFEYKGND
jgi:alpha-N-arabinofuranosidase